jgi:hypothetical protein
MRYKESDCVYLVAVPGACLGGISGVCWRQPSNGAVAEWTMGGQGSQRVHLLEGGEACGTTDAKTN